jgi:hypothetical protein
MGLEQLYKACDAERAANPGKLPVVEYKGSKLEKIGKGTTRIPNFELVSWVARPEGMDAAPVQEVAQPVRTAPAKAAVVEDEDEMF